MSETLQNPGRHRDAATRHSTVVVLGGVGAIVAAQFLLVLMFSWSSSRAAPHGVPLAISGPPAAARGFANGLEQAQEGAFTLTVLSDDAAARAAVLDRQVYASVSLSARGATVYTASAASPAVAQIVTQALQPQSCGTSRTPPFRSSTLSRTPSTTPKGPRSQRP